MEQQQTNLAKKQIDIIFESLCVEAKCIECRELFKKGDLCFDMIEGLVDDRGKSCLFRLKEMCHQLFRNSDKAIFKERLYDTTVGYIFHEAMKLRENLYQIEYYRPWFDEEAGNLTPQERKVMTEIEILIQKAEKKTREGLREIMLLMNQLLEQLKDLIRAYRGNYLMPRFVYENEKSLIRIYGKKGFEELLEDLYNDGRKRLLFKAAESFLGSEYYEKARTLFKKFLHHEKEDKQAQFYYLYSSAFHFYLKNKYSMAEKFAQTALEIESETPIPKNYREQLDALRKDINRELKRIKRAG